MKVLITGATGLIGKELTSLFLSKNIPVNFLTTRKQKLVDTPSLKGFYWNPGSGEINLNCFNDVTAIINLAGASIAKRWTVAYKKEIIQSRISSLETLYKGLKQVDAAKITSFVSASAIGIYPHSLTEYYHEETPQIATDFLGDVTATWETQIDLFNDFNFNIAKIRVGIVLSSEGGALVEMAKPIKNYVGAVIGTGEQWQSWIHVHDIAALFKFVVDHNLEGTYNAVAPNPITHKKLIKEIAKLLKRPLLLPNIPKIMLQLVLGEMSYLLFGSQRVSCRKIEKAGFIFKYTNVNHALENIYLKEPNTTLSKHSFTKEYS